MRYVLYLFTLILVFVGGMLVGNIYLPVRNASVAASISVPQPGPDDTAIQEATLEKAQQNLQMLGKALSSCPVVVMEEKDRLINQIHLLLAKQDFEIKKAIFELEIAKNIPGSAVTAKFAQASANYAAALKQVQTLSAQLFPPPPAAEPAPAEAESKDANETKEPETQTTQSAAQTTQTTASKDPAPETEKPSK